MNLDAIKPRDDGKYSPNLYRWLNSKRAKAFGSHQAFEIVGMNGKYADVWRPHLIIIGDGSAERGVGGRNLGDIICGVRGVWSQSFHYEPSFKLRDITAEFWAEYERIGRCAWDQGHGLHMVGASNRWNYVAGGRQRECNWCGRVFEAETKVEPVIEFKERTIWAPYQASKPATLLHPMGSMGEEA